MVSLHCNFMQNEYRIIYCLMIAKFHLFFFFCFLCREIKRYALRQCGFSMLIGMYFALPIRRQMNGWRRCLWLGLLYEHHKRPNSHMICCLIYGFFPSIFSHSADVLSLFIHIQQFFAFEEIRKFFVIRRESYPANIYPFMEINKISSSLWMFYIFSDKFGWRTINISSDYSTHNFFNTLNPQPIHAYQLKNKLYFHRAEYDQRHNSLVLLLTSDIFSVWFYFFFWWENNDSAHILLS